MVINSGKKSTVVMKVKVNGYERTFEFPEQTDTEAIKNYIIEAAKDYNLTIDENETYYMGNKLISNDTNYNSLDDVDSFFLFISSLAKKDKRSEDTSELPHDWENFFDKDTHITHR